VSRFPEVLSLHVGLRRSGATDGAEGCVGSGSEALEWERCAIDGSGWSSEPMGGSRRPGSTSTAVGSKLDAAANCCCDPLTGGLNDGSDGDDWS